eukprot:767227-Hanusia_phi.AAC.3
MSCEVPMQAFRDRIEQDERAEEEEESLDPPLPTTPLSHDAAPSSPRHIESKLVLTAESKQHNGSAATLVFMNHRNVHCDEDGDYIHQNSHRLHADELTSMEAASEDDEEADDLLKVTRSAPSLNQVDFADEDFTTENDKYKSLVMWIFGIPKERQNLRMGLIHPASLFGTIWILLGASLLLYTAIVTPITIAFFWDSDVCSPIPTLPFDGKYLYERSSVAKHYLRHGFLFDLLTSAPISFVEIAILSGCGGSNGVQMTNPVTLRLVRIIKPLRIFKLLKVLKVAKSSSIASTIGDLLRIPPVVMRLILVVSIIAIIINTCSCIFWLLKVLNNEDLELLLESKNANLEPQWLMGYLVSFYFVVTIFTTVGFGDISPNNPSEVGFVIILMQVGAILFGILLAEVQETMHQFQRVTRERDSRVQQVVDLLRDYEVPRTIETEILNWIKFDHEHKQKGSERDQVLRFLPPSLNEKLLSYMDGDVILRIPLFSLLEHPEKMNLILNLWVVTQSLTYFQGIKVFDFGSESDGLYIITSGAARIESLEQTILTLKKGDYVGDWSLMGEKSWGASSLIGFKDMDLRMVAETNVVAIKISLNDFHDVVKQHSPVIHEELKNLAKNMPLFQRHTQGNLENMLHGCTSQRTAVCWGLLCRKLLRVSGMDNSKLFRVLMRAAGSKLLTVTSGWGGG